MGPLWLPASLFTPQAEISPWPHPKTFPRSQQPCIDIDIVRTNESNTYVINISRFQGNPSVPLLFLMITPARRIEGMGVSPHAFSDQVTRRRWIKPHTVVVSVNYGLAEGILRTLYRMMWLCSIEQRHLGRLWMIN